MAQSPHGWPDRQRALLRAQVRRAVRRRAVTRQGADSLTARLVRVRPWLIAGLVLALLGLMMLAISLIAFTHRGRDLADALVPAGIMLLVTSGAPLMLGLLRFLEPPGANTQRCGRCRFYQPVTEGYTRGWCTVDRPRLSTTSDSGCGRYQFSERAMVRDRLSQAPHILNSRTEA
ncbi:MAG: hypothetical protein H0X24_15280 [Ktedonobacterales bacterium]|nr:hypothetical protein [Ktedonobacterales bacterium]